MAPKQTNISHQDFIIKTQVSIYFPIKISRNLENCLHYYKQHLSLSTLPKCFFHGLQMIDELFFVAVVTILYITQGVAIKV